MHFYPMVWSLNVCMYVWYIGVFKKFEKDGEFFCFPRQSSQSVTAIYNTYRAAQVAFPGENDGVLRRAERYCRAFLQERRASNKLSDKWVIPKDLPGEVDTTNYCPAYR